MVRPRAAAVGAALALAAAALLGLPATRRGSAGEPPPAAPPVPAPAPAPLPAPVPSPAPAEAGTPTVAWLDDPGTAVLGLALLRVAPARPGAKGSIRLAYEEKPDDYASFDDVQLMVLPGDALAADGRCFADRAAAFARSAVGSYSAGVDLAVGAPELLLVGYGPFTGPDTGRPLTLKRAYTLEVARADGVVYRWVDPEAGELNVKGWTRRPEVRRGGPVVDPVTKASHWFEARIEVVYDRERLRAPGDPETPDTSARRAEAENLRRRARELREQGKPDAAKDLDAEAQDVLDQLAASDDRLPVPATLAERLRHLPFRWK